MEPETILHASSVAIGGQGILIVGPAGSGKSSLALQLMAYGADLIADDGTKVKRIGADLCALVPDSISGLIEARGIGILNANTVPSAKLCCVIDMGQTELERLPCARSYMLLGLELPLLYKVESVAFAAGVLQFIKAGRQDTT